MNKANPKVIGAFVVGAIALIVVGVLIFGGAQWFKETTRWVAYFPGSVKGLRVGASVDFRGVRVGRVVEIRAEYDAETDKILIPVIMEIDPQAIVVKGADQIDRARFAKQMIEGEGLRAQLQMESMVTGLLFIELDLLPDTPIRLVGGSDQYPEMPTVPSKLEELQEQARKVVQDIPTLINNVNGLLVELTSLFERNKEKIDKTISNIEHITDALEKESPEIEKMMADAAQAVASIRRTSDTIDELIQMNADNIGGTVVAWRETADSVRRMADQLNQMVAENRDGLRDFTQSGLYEFTGLAQDAQRMVQQITRIAEELERDPARFLFGEKGGGVRTE